MSGCSDSQNCPVCGGIETLMIYTDWKPVDSSSGECLDCGWNFCTKSGRRMSLKEINERRKDYEFEPIKKREFYPQKIIRKGLFYDKRIYIINY